MAEIPQMRLKELLLELTQQGQTQQQIAARINIPSQFLSNLKNGHRPLTELVARRIGTVFHVDYEWLLGNSDEKSPPTIHTLPAAVDKNMVPLFGNLIEGPPKENQLWDGTLLELSGASAARYSGCVDGYVLRCPVDDCEHRICQGDLLLVSQDVKLDVQIRIVKHRKRLVLARESDDGTWLRLSGGQALNGKCDVIGGCTGIVWATLN